MTNVQPDKPEAASALAPFHHAAFAVLWTATVIGNTGTYMRDVASAWLVADLSASPGAVALIQAAGTLPITDRRFNRMRPSIAPRKRHQAG